MNFKFFIPTLIITAFFLFQSTSPWEGAAGVASEGELPVSGFFIATNSFPRNTVVDITNVENGKSTRAIVANTVSNPGLLAVVSRDAADIIGMRLGSISRIRIISPSDPIAYQRFTEGLAQEIPPYDSGNIVRSEAELLNEVYGGDTFRPSSTSAAQETPVSNEFLGPSYQMEPEWGGSARLDIVDIPRFNEEPAGPFTEPVNGRQPVQIVEEPPVREEPLYVDDPVYVADPQPSWETPPVYTPDPVINERPPVQVVEVQEDIVKNVDPFNAEYPSEDINKQTSPRLTEVPRSDVVKDVPKYAAENFDDAIAKHVQVFRPEQTQGEITKDVNWFGSEQSPEEIAKAVERFNAEGASDGVVKNVESFYPELSPTEVVKDLQGYTQEHSPEDIVKIVHGFSPEQSPNEIVKIVQGFYPDMASEEILKILERYEAERTRDEIAKAANIFETAEILSPMVPPIQPSSPPDSEYNLVEAPPRPPEYPYGINPDDIIPGIPSQPAVSVQPPARAVPNQTFSIDRINNLDRGQYYVQIASTSADMVENTIKQFDRQIFMYGPKIFVDRDNLCRIVIGPLNQGESAAVLARFRSIGYRDAFVRHGG